VFQKVIHRFCTSLSGHIWGFRSPCGFTFLIPFQLTAVNRFLFFSFQLLSSSPSLVVFSSQLQPRVWVDLSPGFFLLLVCPVRSLLCFLEHSRKWLSSYNSPCSLTPNKNFPPLPLCFVPFFLFFFPSFIFSSPSGTSTSIFRHLICPRSLKPAPERPQSSNFPSSPPPWCRPVNSVAQRQDFTHAYVTARSHLLRTPLLISVQICSAYAGLSCFCISGLYYPFFLLPF